jgi:hypothetical protein
MPEENDGTQEGAATAVQEGAEEAASQEALAESFAEAFPEGEVPSELEAAAEGTDENENDGASAEEQTSDADTEGEGDGSDSDGQEEAGGQAKPQPKIPYTRFQKVVAERNAAREELAREQGRRLASKPPKEKPPAGEQEEDDSEEPFVATRGEFHKELKSATDKVQLTHRQEMAMMQFNSDMRFFQLSDRTARRDKESGENYQKIVHDPSEAFPEGFYAAIDPRAALRDRNEDGKLTDDAKEILAYWDEILAAEDPAEYLLEFASQAQGIQASPTLDSLDLSDEGTLETVLGKLGVSREKYDEMVAEGTVTVKSAPQEKKPAKKNKSLRTVPSGKKLPSKGPADQEQTFNDTFPSES